MHYVHELIHIIFARRHRYADSVVYKHTRLRDHDMIIVDIILSPVFAPSRKVFPLLSFVDYVSVILIYFSTN